MSDPSLRRLFDRLVLMYDLKSLCGDVANLHFPNRRIRSSEKVVNLQDLFLSSFNGPKNHRTGRDASALGTRSRTIFQAPPHGWSAAAQRSEIDILGTVTRRPYKYLKQQSFEFGLLLRTCIAPYMVAMAGWVLRRRKGEISCI